MNAFLMVFGMPMESFAMILLLSPIFLDAAVEYGLNPVHIAVVFVFNCVIAMISPPFGGTLFISALVGAATDLGGDAAHLPALGADDRRAAADHLRARVSSSSCRGWPASSSRRPG